MNDQLYVLVPYRDLEKLLHLTEVVDSLNQKFIRSDAQVAALHGLFSDCLEKLDNIQEQLADY